MRLATLLFLLSPVLLAQQQPDVWKQIQLDKPIPLLPFATLSEVQQQAIARLILHCCQGSFEGKQGSSPDDILACVDFQEIPLASKQKVVLVSEDQTECYQPGTSAAVPMWIVRMEGDVPVLLASPEHDLFGWLYSIQPTVTKGYHDLVLGWHWSAAETGLTYFQFNGTTYDSVSRAMEICDPDQCRIDTGDDP